MSGRLLRVILAVLGSNGPPYNIFRPEGRYDDAYAGVGTFSTEVIICRVHYPGRRYTYIG